MAVACLPLAGVGCGGKVSSPPPSPQKIDLPQNARLIRAPFDQVWEAVLSTLRLKHLFPITVEDPQKGVFSTEYIYAENNQGRRYRLSGSVVKAEKGYVVTLYRYEQVFRQGTWEVLHTNYKLEEFLLSDILSRFD